MGHFIKSLSTETQIPLVLWHIVIHTQLIQYWLHQGLESRLFRAKPEPTENCVLTSHACTRGEIDH